MIDHLFVYGTLRTGDVRWHLLEPFVSGAGRPDTVAGDVFDTGFDYPAAVFAPPGESHAPRIHGQTFALRAEVVDHALEVLDEVEGVVDGDYERVIVTTDAGFRAWAYASGVASELTRIESGDWLAHRPLPAD